MERQRSINLVKGRTISSGRRGTFVGVHQCYSVAAITGMAVRGVVGSTGPFALGSEMAGFCLGTYLKSMD